MIPAAELADQLTERILASPKYRTVDEAVVRRVAAEAVARVQNRNDAFKYAKRKLHQLFGAFLQGSPEQAVHGLVTGVMTGTVDDIREAALGAMRLHSSSAERAGWLTPLYDQIGTWCGTPASVADLACGLNPLAIPWMHLAPGARYWGCEIDARLVSALTELDHILPVELSVQMCDLVTQRPMVSADVVLLLKTVTTLEQQTKGAARQLILGLDCSHLILSLPRASLSGRRNYADDPERIAADASMSSRFRIRDQASFGKEIVFHLVPDAGEKTSASALSAIHTS